MTGATKLISIGQLLNALRQFELVCPEGNRPVSITFFSDGSGSINDVNDKTLLKFTTNEVMKLVLISAPLIIVGED